MGRMFEKRKHTMFARYDRMAKQFTRVGKEIVIAVKAGGPDPDMNPTLRRAMQNAKGVNMPKDKVEGAIKRALGKDTANYDEVLYEGYGPHGVPILVAAATDNVNRTVANLRAVLSRGGGNLGTAGSVAFQFTKAGAFQLDPDTVPDRDELELGLIDEGLEELTDGVAEDGRDVLVARCAFSDFGQMQKALESRGLEPIAAGVDYVPSTTSELSDEAADEVLELIAKIEADEDVQTVYHNLA
ncbi:YebC/PmpR family DNA-binding transcriptional regulator [Rubrivirga sp. IMCC43871]|uniref:YebC/PmpR family DNA-binding transcriptional regulator n=1 Tax=Rubrivirga sp. IMCC43871 TaxID=3391575 RepID=UPI00398F8F06